MELIPPLPATDAAALITTREFGAAGWTRSQMRAAAARGEHRRERRGVVSVPAAYATYADDLMLTGAGVAERDREQAILRAAAAGARVCSRAVLSHAPAAVVDGLPVLHYAARPCLTVPSGTALRALTELHLHRAAIPGSQLRGWDRFLITRPARTCVDLARESGIDAGVVAMDAALHRGLTTASELDKVLAACTRWPGKRFARAAFELADGRSESPLESLSRLGFLRAGLSGLVPQAIVLDQYGRFVARLDFLWPKLGVAGEADGLGKYGTGFDSVAKQRTREGAATNLGLEFVRWGWPDLADFGQVIKKVEAAAGRVQESRRPQLWRLGQAQTA